MKALEAAGLGTAALTNVEDLLSHEITVFSDRVRIDVQTRTPGLAFEDAWNRRQTMNYEGQSFYVVSRGDLIASKRAAGRPRDLEDVRALESGDAKRNNETWRATGRLDGRWEGETEGVSGGSALENRPQQSSQRRFRPA